MILEMKDRRDRRRTGEIYRERSNNPRPYSQPGLIISKLPSFTEDTKKGFAARLGLFIYTWYLTYLSFVEE